MIQISQNGNSVLVDNQRVVINGKEYINPTGVEQNILIQEDKIYIGDYRFTGKGFVKRKPTVLSLIKKFIGL